MLLLETNLPQDSVWLFKSNVPAVRVKEPSAPVEAASLKVSVPPMELRIDVSSVLPFDVSVPVPEKVGINNIEYTPLADKNKLPNTLQGPCGEQSPEGKTKFLNILLDAIFRALSPVTDTFGAFVEVPPEELPKLNEPVAIIFREKPPVPEYVQLVMLLIVINDVPAVAEVRAILPVPKLTDRTFKLLDEKAVHAKVKLLSTKAPAVRVQVEITVNADPKVQPPPVPLKTTAARLQPLVVMVLPVVVAVNVIVPRSPPPPVNKVKEPAMPNEGVVPTTKDTIPADIVKSKQFSAPVSVTVYVPAWSKKTLSAEVGLVAPAAPPEVADQFVVLVVFQVPEPPTQYRFAI